MVYIYAPQKSLGALELVNALGATRLRKFDGQDFWDKRKRFKLKEGDHVICWGGSVPDIEGVRVLNGLDNPFNKYKEISLLTEAGVPTVSVFKSAPAKQDFPDLLPRVVNHKSGRDLLISPKFPDYYVIKEGFVKEYRVHSFNGKSIRAGEKVGREGFTLVKAEEWRPGKDLIHPWVRSFDAGWRIKYDGFTSNVKLRKYAHLAVKALGLTFGAVDLAERADGALRVLEVNRAPGIEGGSVGSYVRAIKKWMEAKDDVRGAGAGVSEDDSPF